MCSQGSLAVEGRDVLREETRTVSRDGRELLLEAMRQKLRSEAGKQRIYEKRGDAVEPV